MAKNEGYYEKFIVKRVDGRDEKGGDRENAKYFTLDLVHDPYAVPAILAYVAACSKEYPILAKELSKMMAEILNTNKQEV